MTREMFPRHIVRLIVEMADPTVSFKMSNTLVGWKAYWNFRTHIVHMLDFTSGHWNGIRLRCQKCASSP